MTAICGVQIARGHASSERLCRKMIDALGPFGPDDRSVHELGDVAIGRALYRLLPEDRFDRQPLIGDDGRFALVADLRIDNRDEIASDLRMPAGRLARMSDADLLLAGWERWGEGVVDHLNGDFAFAVWDARDRLFTLARDPFGQLPLCYARGRDAAGSAFFAFASMPSGIHASGLVAAAPDDRRVAEYMADLVYPNGRSFFEGVDVVRPGEIVVVSADSVRRRVYWDPQPCELRLPTMDAYVDAFRKHLDRAVAARLRGVGADGRGGTVAAHLSSGYDSSAVAATAARLLKPTGGRVAAFTSAPREGFDGTPWRNRIADESAVAAVTAALHPNIDHVVLRPEGIDVMSLMRDTNTKMESPVGHVCNNVWVFQINEAAAARGIRVLLTGAAGNLTISAGGLFQLADLIRTGRWGRWAREARLLIAGRTVNWRGVLANSFGPWTPLPMWRVISHIFLRTALDAGKPSLLTPEWTEEMAREVKERGRSHRPPRDSQALRILLLRRQDPGHGRKLGLMQSGIDKRDPTVDRPLVEFCLSLPPEMLLKDGLARPLAKAALADRLPAEVLEGRKRGHQMADWYEQITKANVQASLAALEHPERAARVIDLAQLAALIESWPTRNFNDPDVNYYYRGQALHTLSVAHFMDGVGEDRDGKASSSFPRVAGNGGRTGGL